MHVLTYKHTYVHMYLPTYLHTHTHAHTHAHTHTHTRTHAHVHTCMHTHLRTVMEVLHFFRSMKLTADSVCIFYYWLVVRQWVSAFTNKKD